MLSQRLSIAIDDGLVRLPEIGRIAVFEPPIDADLGELPKDRTIVVTRHAPAFERFKAKGHDVTIKPEGSFDLSLVCLPRAKLEARALVATASALTDGPLVIDGQKTDGIESILKEMKQRSTVSGVVVKAHGKLVACVEAQCDAWAAASTSVAYQGQTFATAPGVFSADGVDPGSAALADAFPADMKGKVIDLGAGWGFLTHGVLAFEKVASVDLVETDHVALEAARMNVTDPRASFHWANALTFTSEPADHVICNPPFHIGRSTDPGLGQQFILAAARLLKPRGQLWLVANRHLPYEKTLESAFREVRTLSETGGYKITHALAPRTSRKG